MGSLCKNVVDVMKGNIWLDKTYDSGIEGSPGAHFVVELKTPAVVFDTIAEECYDERINCENGVDKRWRIQVKKVLRLHR
jgi:hypothetical protein